MARTVDEIGAGVTIPAGDAGALVSAVRGLLDDKTAINGCVEAGREWARQRGWSRVAAPLLDFVANPRRDPYRDRFVDLGPEASAAAEPRVNRFKRVLRRIGGRR